MQGIYIDGKRPRSKKLVKEVVKESPHKVMCEATSLTGDEYNSYVADMPRGTSVHFVGPDPYTKRSFYGTIVMHRDGRLTVS